MKAPLLLPRNCANCDYWDGEGWCALGAKQALIPGVITAPLFVVCAKHEPKDGGKP